MNDVLVVIGAGGMGEAIARRCASGRHVLLADVDRDLLAQVTERLTGEGLDVSTHTVDVSSAPR
ncbi:3-hydroxyacyl-CoA dehydrogenase NAD-binding domain-containing protein [Nocardiopsis sp. ARC36]